jgi:hypothetical protein
LSYPVDVEIRDLIGGPTLRNRPNLGSDELLDNVAASKYSAGEVKSIFAISDPHCPMVEFSSSYSSQGFDRARQRASWSFVARNLRHVNLDVEPVRVPIISQVDLAAGSDLNSRNPLSGVPSSGVESAACMLSFVIFPVVDFDDVGNNDQFEKSGKSINTEGTTKSFHDPNELRHLKEGCR